MLCETGAKWVEMKVALTADWWVVQPAALKAIGRVDWSAFSRDDQRAEKRVERSGALKAVRTAEQRESSAVGHLAVQMASLLVVHWVATTAALLVRLMDSHWDESMAGHSAEHSALDSVAQTAGWWAEQLDTHLVDSTADWKVVRWAG